MSETKFTKGNWSVADMAVTYNLEHEDLHSCGWSEISDEFGSTIAISVTTSDHDEEKDANAHLIAAAPEMYDMLSCIYESAQLFGDGTAGVDITELRDLLAKARGEK